MQTIPGRDNSSINDLAWALDRSLNRWCLFSCGLDGLLIEWDLRALKPRMVLPSGGGAAWAIAAQPLTHPAAQSAAAPLQSADVGVDSRQLHAGRPGDGDSSSLDDSDAADPTDHTIDGRRTDDAQPLTLEGIDCRVQESAGLGTSQGCAVLAMATDDGTVRLLSAQDASEGFGIAFGKVLCRSEARALSLAWSPAGNVIYCGFSDGCICGMDAVTGV
jgi:WD40 repeat protein